MLGMQISDNGRKLTKLSVFIKPTSILKKICNKYQHISVKPKTANNLGGASTRAESATGCCAPL